MTYVSMMDTPTTIHECAREIARTHVGKDWDGVTFCGRAFFWAGSRYTGAAKAAIQREIGREETGPSNCEACQIRSTDLHGYLVDQPVDAVTRS